MGLYGQPAIGRGGRGLARRRGGRAVEPPAPGVAAGEDQRTAVGRPGGRAELAAEKGDSAEIAAAAVDDANGQMPVGLGGEGQPGSIRRESRAVEVALRRDADQLAHLAAGRLDPQAGLARAPSGHGQRAVGRDRGSAVDRLARVDDHRLTALVRRRGGQIVDLGVHLDRGQVLRTGGQPAHGQRAGHHVLRASAVDRKGPDDVVAVDPADQQHVAGIAGPPSRV